MMIIAKMEWEMKWEGKKGGNINLGHDGSTLQGYEKNMPVW